MGFLFLLIEKNFLNNEYPKEDHLYRLHFNHSKKLEKFKNLNYQLKKDFPKKNQNNNMEDNIRYFIDKKQEKNLKHLTK